MIRISMSLCLVLLTVACGPNASHSDLKQTKGSSNSADFSDVSSVSIDQAMYPIDADPSLTPGVRCQHPDEQRYPENIDYCRRKVSSSTKNTVIRNYDSKLGFSIDDMNRSDFKIDHYVPLCMGGDNAQQNLWPQHKSVYPLTDPIEMYLCLQLERAQITQNEAIDQMAYAKSHLDEAKDILVKIKAAL